MILLILLVFALAVRGASAQACSTHTSEATCYPQRAQCHWAYGTGTCETGAATTCEQHHRDSTACAADLACVLNILNGVCYTPPPVCTGLGAIACSQRSDCRYSRVRW